MLKKDYLAWEASDAFPLEELRTKFNKLLPFSHHNVEQYVHASNRLFWLVIENAKQHGLIGYKGLTTIRTNMSANELLFDILTVASPIPLLPADVDYYLTAPIDKTPCTSLLADLTNGIDTPKIVWVSNNTDVSKTVTCRLFNDVTQQDMLTVPVILNSNNCYQFDL